MQIDLTNMESVLAAIEAKLETFGDTLPSDKMYKATFVVEEILTNLARHANFEERTENVSLELTLLESNNLKLTFKDNSNAFNLLNFPDPDINASLEDREPGGLGIFMTKKYAKTLQYTYENTYNTLEVIL